MVVTSVAPGSVTMRVTHRVLVTRDTRDMTDGQVAYGGIWCEISSTEQIYNPNTTPRTHRDVVLTGFKRDRAEPDHGVPASSLEQRPPPP